MQFDRALAFDQKHDSGARPQGKVHLQLLGTMVLDQTLDMLFLLGGQAATAACAHSALACIKAANALSFITLNDHANGRVTQSNCLRDPMPVHSALIGADHLPSAFMLRCRTQLASIFLFHADWMRAYARNRSIYGPDL
jgi:hypothetical protein